MNENFDGYRSPDYMNRDFDRNLHDVRQNSDSFPGGSWPNFEDYTLNALGFTCNYGNGSIPTKINGNIIEFAKTPKSKQLDKIKQGTIENKLPGFPLTKSNGNVTVQLAADTLITSGSYNLNFGSINKLSADYTASDFLDATYGTITWTGKQIKPTKTYNSLTCSNGKNDPACASAFNTLGIKSYKDLGYVCDPDIQKGQVPIQVIGEDGSIYTPNSPNYKNITKINIAVDNNNKILNNCSNNINLVPLNTPLNSKTCSDYNTVIDTAYPNICQEAFTKYDLYSATNPLVIEDVNINFNVPSKISTNAGIKIATQNSNTISAYHSKNFNINNSATFPVVMNDILQESPLKLGCCQVPQAKQNAPINVTVRSPIDPTLTTLDNDSKNFGFQKRILTIPANTCPTHMYSGSDYCNMFMQTSCENVQTVFSENKNLNSLDYVNYAPECACYSPATGALATVNSSYNIPPMCYKNGCNVGSQSYIDPVSRAQGICNNTICANIVQLTGITAGNKADINPTLQNTCGSSIPAATNQSAPVVSSPITSQSAPATSQSSPATSQSAPATSQSAPALTNQNVPTSSQSSPVVASQNAQIIVQSTPVTPSQSVPITIIQNSPVVTKSPIISQNSPVTTSENSIIKNAINLPINTPVPESSNTIMYIIIGATVVIIIIIFFLIK